MTVVFDTAQLRAGLRWVTKHISPNPTNPVEAAVVVSAADASHVVLAGTGGDRQAQALVPVKGSFPDTPVGVHAAQFNGIVRSAPGDTVTLELSDGRVAAVVSGPARSKLNLVSLDSHPLGGSGQMKNMPEPGAEFGPSVLTDAVKAVSPALSSDDRYPQFAGIKLDIAADTASIAATDGSVLSVATVKTASSGKELSILLPGKTLQSIVQDVPTEESVRVRWDGDAPARVTLTTKDRAVTFGVLASKQPFPDYKPTLNNQEIKHVVADRRTMSDVLTRCVGTKAITMKVELPNDPGEESVRASARNLYEHVEDLPVSTVEGDHVDPFGLSIPGVTAAVKSIPGDEVQLTYAENHGNGRVVVTPAGSTDVVVVLPVQKVAA